MTDLANKNVLISISLKSERLSLFNYFDNKECEMIYTANDIKSAIDVLENESIQYLVIECSNDWVNKNQDIELIYKICPEIKIILLIFCSCGF